MSARALVIGQGAYLRRATRILEASGYTVWVHLTDEFSRGSVKSEMIISRGNPNKIAMDWPEWLSESPILAANNPFIIRDDVLVKFPHIYNIHVSDVRRNRGLGHLCLLHSLLSGDSATGVTTQRLAAGYPLDGSPTVKIRPVPIKASDSFASLMGKLSSEWEFALKEDGVRAFRAPSQYLAPLTLGTHVSLDLINRLVFEEGAYSDSLAIEGLGNLSRFLPRTERAVADYREFWSRTRGRSKNL